MIAGALLRHYAAWLGSVWTRVASIFSTFVIVIVIQIHLRRARAVSHPASSQTRAVTPALLAQAGNTC
jgi:hypothetical protein